MGNGVTCRSQDKAWQTRFQKAEEAGSHSGNRNQQIDFWGHSHQMNQLHLLWSLFHLSQDFISWEKKIWLAKHGPWVHWSARVLQSTLTDTPTKPTYYRRGVVSCLGRLRCCP